MKEVFLATLNPMLMLFIIMVLGFLLYKIKILPENSGKVMAKLETYLFAPALSFSSMLTVTPQKILTHATNILLVAVGMCFSLCLAILLAKLLVKEKNYERNVYKYALTFGNYGYLADPLVLALFGLEGLAYYKIACLPATLLTYSWGLSQLIPQKEGAKKWQNFFNTPSVCSYLGLIIGLTGLGQLILNTPALTVVTDTLSNLGNCMGPTAMLIAGVTIARFPFKSMLLNKKIYLATALRLVVLPVVIISALFGVKELINLVLSLNIDNMALFLLFFIVATPLGLNTVVYPEAYGGDPSIGAGMATVSHTLCVLTIPLMFAIMTLVFGAPPVFA